MTKSVIPGHHHNVLQGSGCQGDKHAIHSTQTFKIRISVFYPFKTTVKLRTNCGRIQIVIDRIKLRVNKSLTNISTISNPERLKKGKEDDE